MGWHYIKGTAMTSDAFLHKMQRFEEDVQEHPHMLKEWAVQEQLLHNLEGLQRELDLLAKAIRGGKQ